MSTYYSPKDDISFIPLNCAEEKELFRRFYKENDLTARDEIVKRHLKLAAKLGLLYAKGAILDEDAISAANFGLIQALESRCFNPELGYLFSSYVRSYIRGQVLKALRANGWKGCLGNPEDDEETYAPEATVTGSQCDDAKRFRRNGFTAVPRARRCPAAEVDTTVEDKQLNEVRRDVIDKALDQLPDLEADTVRSHFFRGQNFADIGRTHELTREGIRKAFNRGMDKLKALLATSEPELS